jgi:thiamine pyrophosphate-dependent acetolactate synthase large subunit-like protein
VTGDGGFGQYMGGLTTAVKYGMNITHVLLNNNELGKISKEQRAGMWDVWQTALHNPNFAEFAESCGALGVRVTEKGQLDEALRRGLALEGPALIDVLTDAELIRLPEDHVIGPMVAIGKGTKDPWPKPVQL